MYMRFNPPMYVYVHFVAGTSEYALPRAGRHLPQGARGMDGKTNPVRVPHPHARDTCRARPPHTTSISTLLVLYLPVYVP